MAIFLALSDSMRFSHRRSVRRLHTSLYRLQDLPERSGRGPVFLNHAESGLQVRRIMNKLEVLQ
jgi:hypothetical protein